MVFRIFSSSSTVAPRRRVSWRIAAAGTAALFALSNVPTQALVVSGDIEGLALSDMTCEGGASATIIKQPHGKYENTPVDELPASLVSGVDYTMTRVEGVDLRTEEGLKRAQKLSVTSAKSMLSKTVFAATTDASGRAKFNNLDIGLYLVHENGPKNKPEGYWSGRDFLLFVPAGRAADTEPAVWDCDVEVYTKDLPDPGKEKESESSTPSTTPKHPHTPVTPPDFPPPHRVTVTTTPPPTLTTPPGVPPVVTSGVPSTPLTPGEPDKPSGIERLARTGASVLGVVAVGAVLFILGGLLMRRRRDGEE